MLPDSYEYLKKPLKPSSEKTKRQQQKIGWAVVIVVFTKKKNHLFYFRGGGKSGTLKRDLHIFRFTNLKKSTRWKVGKKC